MNNQLLKIVFIFILSTLFIGCNNDDVVEEKTIVDLNGKLKVEGTQLKNEKGDPMVLRGVSFGWHNWWPRFYTKEAVSWLAKDWKCSVVRAAIGVGANIEKSYLQNPYLANSRLDNVVEGAIEAGIYVIVDFHSHDIYKEQAIEFFTNVAKKYGHHPNVIYEIFNEPDFETWAEVKAYSEEVIKAIRAIDPDNIILVGSPHWCQDLHLVAEDPIVGQTNIMYTMHFYAATHKKWLRDRTDAAIAKGIPVFVSECAGVEATGDGPIDREEWKAYLDWMEARKLSWAVWSISDKDETSSILFPTADSKGNWELSQIKEWGKICRTAIIEKNGKK